MCRRWLSLLLIVDSGRLVEELTFLEIDFFRKILVLALAGAQRGVNAVQRAVIQAWNRLFDQVYTIVDIFWCYFYNIFIIYIRSSKGFNHCCCVAYHNFFFCRMTCWFSTQSNVVCRWVASTLPATRNVMLCLECFEWRYILHSGV